MLHCRDLSNQHIFIDLDATPGLRVIRTGALAVEILPGGIPVNIKVKQRRAKPRIAKIAMTAKIEN